MSIAVSRLDPFVDSIAPRAKAARDQAPGRVGLAAQRPGLGLPGREPGPHSGILILAAFEVVRPHGSRLEGGCHHAMPIGSFQPIEAEQQWPRLIDLQNPMQDEK